VFGYYDEIDGMIRTERIIRVKINIGDKIDELFFLLKK
jgi:hypothetical protein